MPRNFLEIPDVVPWSRAREGPGPRPARGPFNQTTNTDTPYSRKSPMSRLIAPKEEKIAENPRIFEENPRKSYDFLGNSQNILGFSMNFREQFRIF